jgi:enoyl-CoA hydratase/carnithine racemase
MTPSARFRARALAAPDRGGSVRFTPGVVAEIVLDAPWRLNALSAGMMVALHDAARAVAGARVMVLRGEGEAFCAGGDLGEIRESLAAPGVGEELNAFMLEAVAALEAAAPVRVAAVTGPALGGGAELLSACDVVFGSPTATVGWVQARLGLCPGFGGGQRLVQRLGPARAKQLLVEARVLGSEEALAMGLFTEVVPDPVAAAWRWASAVAERPEGALRAAAALVRGGIDAERAQFAELWGGAEHVDALASARAGRRG